MHPDSRPRYRWHGITPGFLAWLLHRLSGLILGGYLFLHIWVVHHLAKGEQAFNDIMAVVQSPFFHLMEIGLLGTVLYHSLNGLRVTLVDFNLLQRRQVLRRSAMAVLALSIGLTLAGSWPFLRLALAH